MDKLEKVRSAVRKKKKIIIAFSGGVDSGLVAKIAHDELGEKAIAVTVDSEQFSRKEIENARRVAHELGIKHVILGAKGLYRTIADNEANRCYLCKKNLADILQDFARTAGIETIADGANTSDISEHRPGITAATEANIWHPLIEAKITKSEARKYAQELGLSFYDRPSMACLASRLPYGEKITKAKLRQVELAERYLDRLGFTTVRVRHHGDIARIEVAKNELGKALEHGDAIVKKLKELGFIHVALDLQGYRSGAMDEALEKLSENYKKGIRKP